jgi:hypothetical protein
VRVSWGRVPASARDSEREDGHAPRETAQGHSTVQWPAGTPRSPSNISRYFFQSLGIDWLSRGAGGGEGGVELSVCPSVCVSPFSSLGALWEDGFAFKVQIFFAQFG